MTTENNTNVSTSSMHTIASLTEYCADHDIKIKGIENIPDLAIAEIITQNPFNQDDESLYFANKKFITMAKLPNGQVTHHRQVSDQFRVVPYEHTIQTVLDHVIQNNPEYGKPELNLKFSNHGGHMFTMMKFTDVQLNVGTSKKPDKISPMVGIKDAIDLSGKYEILSGGLRWFCLNGMMIAHPDFQINKFRMMHKTNTYQLSDALAAVSGSLDHLSKATDLWKIYVEEKISTLQLADVLDASGLSLRSQEKVLNLPLLGGKGGLTALNKVSKGHIRAWDAYNAVTQFATHNILNPKVEVEVGLAVSAAIDEVLGTNKMTF